MRLFVAADIPSEVRERLAECQRRLRDLPLPVRWTRPEGIHLTFFFLGETAEERIPAVEAAIEEAARGAARFSLTARGVTAFPDHGRPRVIVFGIGGDLDGASRLKRGLDPRLGPLGFRVDDRPFRPHLTLGRTKEGRAGDWKAALARERDAEGGRFDVGAVALYESRLGPGGSQYRVVREFPLGGGGAPPRSAGTGHAP